MLKSSQTSLSSPDLSSDELHIVLQHALSGGEPGQKEDRFHVDRCVKRVVETDVQYGSRAGSNI